jgi:hypothetical protein
MKMEYTVYVSERLTPGHVWFSNEIFDTVPWGSIHSQEMIEVKWLG